MNLSPDTQPYRPLEALVPAHWQNATLSANGLRQHYTRTRGDKPALILLHGFMMNGLTWLSVAKALEADFDIIMPDARGHGLTGGEPTGKAGETLVQDTIALIDALDLERPFVLGHSMGAGTALHLALQYPERVRAIVLADPGLRPIPSTVWESDGYKAWRAQWTAYMQALPTQTHEERVAATLAQMPQTASYPEAELVTWIEAQAQYDLAMTPYFTDPSDTEVPLNLDLIPQVTVPQLLILAAPGNAPFITEAAREQFRRDVEAVTCRWQTGELAIFEGSGHFLHLDAFERFVEAVRTFLQRY